MSGHDGRVSGGLVSLLELRLRPEAVADAPRVIAATLEATRAFPGCRGVDVRVDVADATRVVVVEQWESLEADDAYRAWRATPEGASDLRTLVAEPPRLTRTHALPGA